MPASSRARAGELPIEDDWTRVKDPKEKKRIQNRVAQRTYRHRMKARLGELQARLDSHEAKTSGSGSDNSDTFSGDAAADKSINVQHIPLLQNNVYEHPASDVDGSIFPQAARLLNSPPASNGSPQPHSLLSPERSERPTKVSQDFMVDCLRFQTQLLNRLNSLQQESNMPPGAYPPGNHAAVLDPMGVGTFTPTNTDTMDLSLEPQLDLWKAQQHLEQKLRGPGPTTDPGYMMGLTGDPSTQLAPSLMATVKPQVVVPPNHATLDDRFELIMQQAEASGFDNFDELAVAYYRDTFSEASPMANEQRLSRNRRLPKVISDVFVAATKWTAWERRGFQEEILKSTETMLMAESNRARNSMAAKIGPLLEAQDSSSTAEALASMKKSVQEELPNSWAVSMALAADNRTSWQRDRSNTALATVLLLNFAGRIPNEQLLRLIGTCL